MAEGEGVDAVVGFVFGAAVVEEASYEAALLILLANCLDLGFGVGKMYGACVLINHQCQPVESPNCVYARCANLISPVLC